MTISSLLLSCSASGSSSKVLFLSESPLSLVSSSPLPGLYIIASLLESLELSVLYYI
jgi:hypothetical protein